MEELNLEILCQLSGEELYLKAVEYKNNKDYTNCYIYMTMSANYDYELAKDNIYADNLYLKQDHNKTLSFYEKTINLKATNSYSLHYLGFMYDMGLGVKKNYKKAMELYKKAIKKNNSDAMNNLAYMYEHELGVKRNYRKAIELYKKGIEKNCDFAMNNLI